MSIQIEAGTVRVLKTPAKFKERPRESALRLPDVPDHRESPDRIGAISGERLNAAARAQVVTLQNQIPGHLAVVESGVAMQVLNPCHDPESLIARSQNWHRAHRPGIDRPRRAFGGPGAAQ